MLKKYWAKLLKSKPRVIASTIPYIKLFILIFIIFNLLLAAVYSIQSAKLDRNISDGIAFLEKEGKHLNLFRGVSDAFRLDTYTDRVMLRTLHPKNPSLGPWLAAMDMNNYSRYWHGYTVILRPLMCLFNYSQLRLLNVFLITVFSLITIGLLAKYVNIQASIAFILALFCIKIFIVPLSLALCSMFYVFFVFLFILLSWSLVKRCPFHSSLFFSLFIFTLGTCTAFIDLLTTPLLPVGLLLAIAWCGIMKDIA